MNQDENILSEFLAEHTTPDRKLASWDFQKLVSIVRQAARSNANWDESAQRLSRSLDRLGIEVIQLDENVHIYETESRKIVLELKHSLQALIRKVRGEVTEQQLDLLEAYGYAFAFATHLDTSDADELVIDEMVWMGGGPAEDDKEHGANQMCSVLDYYTYALAALVEMCETQRDCWQPPTAEAMIRYAVLLIILPLRNKLFSNKDSALIFKLLWLDFKKQWKSDTEIMDDAICFVEKSQAAYPDDPIMVANMTILNANPYWNDHLKDPALDAFMSAMTDVVRHYMLTLLQMGRSDRHE